MVFDHAGRPVASAYKEHRQIFPKPGWVEHDAREIWANALETAARALESGGIEPAELAAVGITNQRETTVLWDAETGEPVHNAIVWQDRRTSARCESLKAGEWNGKIRSKTGLPPDPYFSASKIEWLLKNVRGVRKRAEKGKVLFGNIDSWLIWKLTGRHATDATNASRTMLFNLREMDWDDELLKLFGVPREMLPEARSSSEVYGTVVPSRLGDLGSSLSGADIPVAGDLGDQQAALFGQAAFKPGEIKNTYGTGSFLLRNTGKALRKSENGLLTTVAYSLPAKSPIYALEGSVFITGAAVQWLRDGLGLIASAAETEALAASVPDAAGVSFVPAFAGLGAPYWNPYARGTIVGLTRGATKAHLVRATLEAIAFQTRDVVEAMSADCAGEMGAAAFKVDGGAVKNNFLCQFQSDVLGLPVMRPAIDETTALGAAYAAGLAVGFWKSENEIRRLWKTDRVFKPRMSKDERESRYGEWKRAVDCALRWAGSGGNP